MPASSDRPGFGRRHPFLLGISLVVTAMVLIIGAMAVFRSAQEGPLLGGDTIGVVNVEGLLADPDKTVEWIRTLERDSSVKGVVLRINSPGGVVGPSQEIFRAVRKLREKKPVVASMGAVAASGGYYVACAAQRIVANPGTLTGSIGVRLDLTNLQELTDKLGIKHDSLVSGQYKSAGSMFRKLTPEERTYLQGLVMDMHQQFVGDVAESRNMPLDKVKALADGRAFTGRQALEMGLVDELGGMPEAVDALKGILGLKGEPRQVKGPKNDKGFLMSLLTGSSSLGLDKAMDALGPRWQFLYN